MPTARRAKASPPASSAAANPDRGEHRLTLEGRDYLLRPTFAAMQEIEASTGKGIIELARKLGAMTLTEMGIIASALIREGAAPNDRITQMIDDEAAARMIYETGMNEVGHKLVLCLFDAVTGGRDCSGNTKAAETSPISAA